MFRLTFLLVFWLFSTYISAQEFRNKGANVFISPNTIFTVQDGLINEGNLTNNGDLRISGPWINLGTYDAGIGQINFNSDLPQTINHNDQSFRRLVISGAGEKLFLANITIEEELDLQNSILRSSNGAKIVFQQGATISGGSANSHIVGAVEHIGAGDWLFPVGNGTDFLPVTIKGITDSNATGTLLLTELTTADILTGDVNLLRLSNKRYYDFTSTGVISPSATVTLPLAQDDFLDVPVSQTAIAGSNSIPNGFVSLGQSSSSGTLTSGEVTSALAITYRYLAIGAVNNDRTIQVYNGISPNDVDDLNSFFRIERIQFYPDNEVVIFNRWGDRVFEAKGYNNADIAFRGKGNVGNAGKVPAGTYFYSILPGDGSPRITGYLEIRY
jgi:hypothetical protein